VRAVQATDGGVIVRDFAVPVPGPGEVLVKVGGAGLCHSDCAMGASHAFYKPDGTGLTLGHETGWLGGISARQGKVVCICAALGRCPSG